MIQAAVGGKHKFARFHRREAEGVLEDEDVALLPLRVGEEVTVLPLDLPPLREGDVVVVPVLPPLRVGEVVTVLPVVLLPLREGDVADVPVLPPLRVGEVVTVLPVVLLPLREGDVADVPVLLPLREGDVEAVPAVVPLPLREGEVAAPLLRLDAGTTSPPVVGREPLPLCDGAGLTVGLSEPGVHLVVGAGAGVGRVRI